VSSKSLPARFAARVLFAEKIHKQAEGPDDNQDAYMAEANSTRFAIADGTTTSFFSKPWARLLVQHFCEDEANRDLERLQSAAEWDRWLSKIRQKWQQEVQAQIGRTKGPQSIMLQNRFAEQQGAAATFVGLQLDYQRSRWQALTVGDSCLVHLRDGRLLQSLPLTNADEFSNITEAISSGPGAHSQPTLHSGEFAADDTFVLLTDAIARWLLTRHDNNGVRWSEAVRRLTGLRNWDDLQTFVQAERSSRALANDDVTIVVVRIDAATDASTLTTASLTPFGERRSRAERRVEAATLFGLEAPERRAIPDRRSSGVPATTRIEKTADVEIPSVAAQPASAQRLARIALVIAVLSLFLSAAQAIPWDRIDLKRDRPAAANAKGRSRPPTQSRPAAPPPVNVPAQNSKASSSDRPVVAAGTIVFANDSGAEIVGRTQRTIPVDLGGTESDSRRRVELTVWVRQRREPKAEPLRGRFPVTLSAQRAYADASTSAEIMTLTSSTSGHEIVSRKSDDPQFFWYRLKVEGYVASPSAKPGQ
jgi:serine/threonine protein phosphatase PrpC